MNREDIELTPRELLQKYWGYDDFRSVQKTVIDEVLAGRDALAILPTGGGKSVIYQIPMLKMEGVTIVVTPLLALMKDQVARLQALGIPAVAIHSGVSKWQVNHLVDLCMFRRVKILYLSPERLSSSNFRDRLKLMNISMVAVDEAHCISHWGGDFRPSYNRIGEIREMFPDAPFLALTASATNEVCEDIIASLKLRNVTPIKGDFSRPNLSYVVRKVENKQSMLLKILSSVDGATIVYTRTREGAEKLSELINQNGYSSIFYHAGLPHAERSIRQDEWINGQYRVMVATNAFGMGVDKPDVRLVIHYFMSNSLEGYYQEAGRAGRDGKRSYAALLYDFDDVERAEKVVDGEFPELDLVKEYYDKLCSMFGIAYGEGAGAMVKFDMRKFCYDNKIYHKRFINILKLLEMNDYMILSEDVVVPTQIMFIVARDELYRVRVNNPDIEPFVAVLLRLYSGIFTDMRSIDEAEIADLSGYTLTKVRDLLAALWRMRLIRYYPSSRSSMITILKDREPKKDIYISPKSYKYRRESQKEKLQHVVRYIQDNKTCRSRILMQYFGVDADHDCGACDNCLANRK